MNGIRSVRSEKGRKRLVVAGWHKRYGVAVIERKAVRRQVDIW